MIFRTRFTRAWVSGLVSVCTAVGTIGCTTAPAGEVVGQTQQRLGEAVSTDKATYTLGESVVVSFSSMPGNQADWIAISQQGSAVTSFWLWRYTLGATSGSMSFAGLPAGNWVARAYLNDSYTLLAESAAFTVSANSGTASVSSDKATYSNSESCLVTFANLPGYANDWLSIAPQGSSATSYVKWQYTGGASSGTRSFDLRGLSGTYVARAYANDGYTILAESSPFTVGSSSAVTTDATSYAFGVPVTITFSGAPGNTYDWIGIAPQGAAADVCGTWIYTNGDFSGSWQVSDLPPGTFVARLYENDSYTVVSTSAPFTVGDTGPLPVTLTPSKTKFSGLEPVVIDFSGMQGNATDWIALTVSFAPMSVFATYAYTGGATSGSVGLFAHPFPAGTYEARAFFNDGYELQGRTTSAITVTAGVATDKASYTQAENVVVSFGGMEGWLKDWVSIAPAGSAATTFLAYKYTNGRIRGTASFSAADLAPGTYVARAYFNDGSVVQAESASFTVQ